MTVGTRHHFVPQLLVRNFVDDDGWVYGFDKERLERSVFRSRPENIFVERHLYSSFDAEGNLIPNGEELLQKVEDVAAPIVRKILAAARQGMQPLLSREERGWWDVFFFLQWKRAPDMHRSLTPDHEILAGIEKSAEELRVKSPELSGEIDALLTPTKRIQMVKNARIDALLRMGEVVPNVLASRGIAILVVAEKRRSFVLGSHPVVKLGLRQTTDLRDPRSEAWLPIASDVAVGPGTLHDAERVFTVRSHGVRQLNMAICQQSSTIAAKSSRLARSLLNPR